MNVRALVYNTLRRGLSQEQRGRIKRSQQKLRNRLGGFYRIRYGTFFADELKGEIAGRIGTDFDVLMVHSAVDSMGPMFRGSAMDLKRILVDLSGPDKTLAMPAFFFGGADFDPIRHYRKNPVFDLRKTPSQMGLVTELFRRHPGVRRSLHPTYSVCAVGPLADELTAGHQLDAYGCGPQSPFAVMDRRRTVVLGIGLPYYRCLTQVHHVEHVMGDAFPAPCREETVPVVLVDGEKNRFDYLLRVKTFEGQRRIEKLDRFLPAGDMKVWRFHGVEMFAISAGNVTRALLAQAKEGRSIYSP